MVCDGNVLFYEDLLQHLAEGITVFAWLSILLSLNPFQLIKIQYKVLLFVCFKLTRAIIHFTFNVLEASFFLGVGYSLETAWANAEELQNKTDCSQKKSGWNLHTTTVFDMTCIQYIICMGCEEVSENRVLKISSLRSLKFDQYFWGFLSVSPTDAS